jgi:hypothetical protein
MIVRVVAIIVIANAAIRHLRRLASGCEIAAVGIQIADQAGSVPTIIEDIPPPLPIAPEGAARAAVIPPLAAIRISWNDWKREVASLEPS